MCISDCNSNEVEVHLFLMVSALRFILVFLLGVLHVPLAALSYFIGARCTDLSFVVQLWRGEALLQAQSSIGYR